MAKGNLTAGDLEWLVKSRAANQQLSLRLYTLLRSHKDILDQDLRDQEGQILVGVCLSLWRAAFMAHKSVKPEDVLHDNAMDFLREVISDSSIGDADDENVRGWAFNYYAGNAWYRLNFLRDYLRWPIQIGEDPGPRSLATVRWEHIHAGLVTAIAYFETSLDAPAL